MNGPNDHELPPDQAPAADLPVHARERLTQMRKSHFFTSDLSVSEFLLVREVGFDPLGLVMGSSIYHIKATFGSINAGPMGVEFVPLSHALEHSRELAMTRMEEEALALGADGVIGVRLTVNLHAWGNDVIEFMAVGTAVRWRGEGGGKFRNRKGMPFTSDLSGQDFWTLLRSGYHPVGFAMGNCVYYVPPTATADPTGMGSNYELAEYTHAFYDARELAIERLQLEAEELGAQGIVGVTVHEKQHSWKGLQKDGSFNGELIEFFVVGTAVIPMPSNLPIPVPTLVIPANAPEITRGGEK